MAGQILQNFREEALRVIAEADKRGATLRLLGALAIQVHCPKYRGLYEEMQRPLTDLDFITRSKNSQYLTRLFRDLGYEPNEIFIQMHGHSRHIYQDPLNRRIADVFLDKLSFCHTIDLANRLELDSPTVPLADLLLEKMQIVHINEKDLKDSIVLLAEHEVGDTDSEMVNGRYIAQLLSGEWGFWYTVTTNLKRLKDYIQERSDLDTGVKKTVVARIDNLLRRLDDEPKTFGWKMRARIGPSMMWYNEVEEVVR